jgi:signal transduction histidine kinase
MMNNFFNKGSRFDIYSNNNRLKWVILVVAVLISAASIYYTDVLVSRLKDREQRLIELYAKTQEYIANETNWDNLNFLFQEIIVENNTIPVIWTDGADRPIDFRNLNIDPEWDEAQKNEILRKELSIMKAEHDPILITFRNNEGEVFDYQYLYYKNSFLLSQLKYYPYVQLSIIAIFGFLAYLAFNYSRTAEQNRVWVGLAKETAHQLGTPLSSLMAWLEYFKHDPDLKDKDLLLELEKDIQRLEMITARFSSIGSVPKLSQEEMAPAVQATINYLQRRISSKVRISVSAEPKDLRAKVNRPLFDWVVENLCKNAVDAMAGSGSIDIRIKMGANQEVLLDFTDTGKGIPKSKVKQVFKPGYTTKTRGWGLGLTLVKRIIENYHQGRIFVKQTETDKGTTFRIILPS